MSVPFGLLTLLIDIPVFQTPRRLERAKHARFISTVLHDGVMLRGWM